MTGAPFPRHSHLRLVEQPPQPRRRLSVRVSVLNGRSAFGQSRVLHLSERDIDELVAHAERMERA